MAFKLLILLAAVAATNAGYLGAPAAVAYSSAPAVSHVSYASPIVSYGTPAITTQEQNILRSPGNLAQISTYSKTIDTPFSSVSKSDVRVSNPGLAVAAAPLAYAAPAPVFAKTYAAPALTYAAPAPVIAKTYAAPALTYAAPAPVIAKTYAAPAYAAPAYAAPAYAAPAYAASAYAAPAIATGHGLLGVAYSAAPAVSHMTYSNGFGLNYQW